MEKTKNNRRFSISVEPVIYGWLKARARANDRSMSAEVLRILKETKEAEHQEEQSTAA